MTATSVLPRLARERRRSAVRGRGAPGLPPGPAAALALAFAGIAAGACAPRSGGEGTGEIGASIEPSRVLASSPALLDEGRSAFEKHCAACHGRAGDGNGEAAYLLYPRPRDFTTGLYRLVSTWEGVPTDADLFRTISRGMPGSAMPSWAHLAEETRWGLVHYVKELSGRNYEIPEPAEPEKQWGAGRGEIRPGAPPADTPEGLARARELFAKACAPCHGPAGKGDGRQEQVDSKGRPTRPRDLTAGVYKGAPEPEQVYRRIVAGLPGSPMPSSPYLHGDDGWLLTRYVLSLSSEEQRERSEMKRYRIVAQRVGKVPDHPDSGVWRSVGAASLHLMPLWWRGARPEELTVKAVHDGEELALLLVWPDATYDHTAIRPQDFRDGAAVQFALDREPPFFAMGESRGRVNIWMWKSERQADLEPAFQDLDKIYPNLGIDSYPNFLLSPVEQPTRHALTLESDPTYVTAWGVGNVVSDPASGRAAEDLVAEGFGSLRARPGAEGGLVSIGVHSTGSYRVLFRRRFAASGPAARTLRLGETVPVAFAVWDGSAGDRDGKKSVTIWQELALVR